MELQDLEELPAGFCGGCRRPVDDCSCAAPVVLESGCPTLPPVEDHYQIGTGDVVFFACLLLLIVMGVMEGLGWFRF